MKKTILISAITSLLLSCETPQCIEAQLKLDTAQANLVKLDKMKEEAERDVQINSLELEEARILLDLKEKKSNNNSVLLVYKYIKLLSESKDKNIKYYLRREYRNIMTTLTKDSFINNSELSAKDIKVLENIIISKRNDLPILIDKKNIKRIISSTDSNKLKLRKNPLIGLKSDAIILKKFNNGKVRLTLDDPNYATEVYSIKLDGIKWSYVKLKFRKQGNYIKGWILNETFIK